MLLFFGAAVAASPSWLHGAALGTMTAALVLRCSLEEKELARAFPSYADYASRTSRLIPWVF